MGRLRDAYHALLGRTTSQVEIARMKTEWAGLMLDVANLMDKLGSMVGRLSKRQTRKAARKLEPAKAESGDGPAAVTMSADRWSRKAALRARRLGRGPTALAVEPEPEEEE